jgi:hypothetical protein
VKSIASGINSLPVSNEEPAFDGQLTWLFYDQLWPTLKKSSIDTWGYSPIFLFFTIFPILGVVDLKDIDK